MKAYIGGGWHVRHLSDRCIELQKDDWGYRRLTGRDGFVRVRGEPGLDRAHMIHKALQLAAEADAKVSHLIAADVMPSAAKTRKYRQQVKGLAVAFRTPEEPELIGVKRA